MEKLKFDPTIAGKIATANSGAWVESIQPGKGYTVNKGATAILSGLWCERAGTWNGKKAYLFQIYNAPEYAILGSDGEWSLSIKTQNTYSQKNAQSLVNGIIKNNKHILENNLLCARFSYKFTAAQKKQLYNLQTRLTERNEQLKNNEVCTALKESYPKGYNKFESYLQTFMNQQSIGIAVSTIIISAIVIAAVSTAAYYLYKVYFDESEQDVKYSDELTKILMQKLTAEEYEQLMRETKGIVTKAKLQSRFSNLKKYILWGVAGIAAAFAIKKLVIDE